MILEFRIELEFSRMQKNKRKVFVPQAVHLFSIPTLLV